MAIREGNDNSLPYRTPVTLTSPTVPYTQDEQHYNTLRMVQSIFAEAIEGLYKEFNAFDVLGDGANEAVRDKMMRQVAGNQIAYDILSPLKERLDSALATVDDNFKQKESKMSEPVVPATGGDAPAPAPADAPAPAPAAPAADLKPGALSPEEQAAQTEDAEWDDAYKEAFPGLKSVKKKEGADESAESKKDDKKTPEGKKDSDDKEPNAEPGTGDDTKTKSPAGESAGIESKDPAAAEREARATARAATQRVEAIKSEVREKMFADVPRTLVDADRDPINSIDDVMKLVNPRTGDNFTEEEAGMWLLSAQQQFNQKTAEMDRTIENISELNLDIKDQADSVTAKYGDWLKANPEKRDSIWAEFEKTLIKHPESGLIIHAPIGLEWFYDQTLGPSVEAQKEVAKETADQKAAEEEAAAEEQAEAEKKEKQNRADRSDIYGGSNLDTRDAEDKEWDDAAAANWPEHFKKK